MKCESCGFNLKLEDKFCPHCGTKNIQAAEHSKAMEAFQKDFEQTRQEVIDNTRKFNALTVRFTIIALLTVLILANLIIIFKSYDIREAREKRLIKRNEAQYIEEIKRYEANRDISGLYRYMDSKHLSYVNSGKLKQYSAVYYASYYCTSIESEIRRLCNDNRDKKYYSDEYCFERIVDLIGYLEPNISEDNYNKEALSEERGEYVEYVRGFIEDIFEVYLGFSEEESASIWKLSSTKLGVMIEEGYNNVKEN